MKLFKTTLKHSKDDSCCGIKIEEIKDENQECCQNDENVNSTKGKCC